jgi:hypothetical protein
MVPGDDGFLWSLRMARLICALLMCFPLLFLACLGAILLQNDTPHYQPILIGVLAALAVAITPAAPYVRERIAQAGIAVHIDKPQAWRRILPVYSTFAAATIAGFLVAQAPALFGFVASALTRDLTPLAIGSVASLVAWAIMWPSRALWSRWTFFAGIGRETPHVPEPGDAPHTAPRTVPDLDPPAEPDEGTSE